MNMKHCMCKCKYEEVKYIYTVYLPTPVGVVEGEARSWLGDLVHILHVHDRRYLKLVEWVGLQQYV